MITARKRSLGQGNIFTPVCHSVHRGGVHGCSGGCAWFLWGGMRGCSQGGSCMVAPGGCAWLLWGGMRGSSGGHAWLLPGHGCSGGVCVVAPGGACAWFLQWRACMVARGGCAWDTTTHRDTVNERAVRILLECILV